MKILMVSHHGCIRVLKESLALKARGHQVHLAMYKPSLSYGFDGYDSVQVWFDADPGKRAALFEKIIRRSEADVIHVHNEPDDMVWMARQATSKPIVYDVHDLMSMRAEREPDDNERRAFEAADGIVHVSEPCCLEAERLHGNGKPTVILPPLMNERFIGPKSVHGSWAASWTSLVYEGGLSSTPGHLRDMRPVVEAAMAQGFNAYLFAANGDDEDYTYEALGACVMRRLPYPTMLAGLRACAWGFVGSAESNPLMEAANPNKLYEYISQGVIPVCLHANNAAKLCEQWGIGIRLTGLDDLEEQLAPNPAMRQRALELRHELTMERHIEALEQLYEEVV